MAILKVVAVLSLAGLATHAFGDDLLSGTETSLFDTLKGTGKKYIYATECIVALLTGIITRNWMACTGVVIVAVFFNVMLTMTGSV